MTVNERRSSDRKEAPASSSAFDLAAFVREQKASNGPAQTTVVVEADCVSTQDVAKTLAAEGAPAWTCVVADRQREGRGRAGRSWTTLDHSLAFSVVLCPSAPPAKWVRITSLAGLALVDTVHALGGKAQLKWPNDLILAPSGTAADGPLGPYRKVAGLLVDGVTRGAKLDAAILGIGINVGPTAIAPPLDKIATTLAEVGVVATREELLAKILSALGTRLMALSDAEKMDEAIAALTAASFTIGKEIVQTDGIEGRACGLDPDGALIVEQSDGTKRQIWAGDVLFKALPRAE